MIGLLQRVESASVRVGGARIAEIGTGLLVYVGVERGDEEATAGRLLERLVSYRVFPDAEGRMNRSVRDVGGGLLLVPQFTLPADTSKGTRPSFTPSAVPEVAQRLYSFIAEQAWHLIDDVQCGQFGADMRVESVNVGPVTFWLRAAPLRSTL